MQNASGLPQTEIAPELVLAELETILASKPFVNSARLSKLLRYIVEQTLQGNASTLKEYQLGKDVFDRNGNYDTRTDPVVRVEARQLRFKLTEYYAGPGRNDAVIISCPKGGYSGRFEQRVPEAAAEAREEPGRPEVTPSVQSRSSPQRRLTFLAAAGVTLVAFLVYGFTLLRSSPEDAHSIAVLPFKNLSADPANQYFSDGLTDEITDALAHVKTLRVIARSSALQFKGKEAEIREAGRQLNVGTVLQGSVERYANRVKIVARLERVSDGAQLWSSTYERQTSDLFSVQSELAAAIAFSLKASINGRSHVEHVVTDEEAHDSYMRGRYELDQLTPASLARAEKAFQHAIERDPNYAAAYAGLGTVKYDQGAARGGTFRTEEERRSCEKFSRKALQLDPDLPTPHVDLALLAMQYDWDWTRAEQELQSALASGPSADAESRYGSLLVILGRFAEGDVHLRRAQDLDPLGTRQCLGLAMASFWEGRFAKAREEAGKVLARSPNVLEADLFVSLMHVYEGRPNLAFSGFQKLERRFPPVQLFEAIAKAHSGEPAEALRLLRPFEDKAESGAIPMQWVGIVYAHLGDVANAVKWLERSADRREFQLLNIAVNPTFAPFENTPGFKALKKRMRLERD